MRNVLNTVMTAAVLVGVTTTHATAQTTVTVAPGAQYGASETHEWFFGDGYRPLWQMPVRVPVLDLGKYAGGLKPAKEGGGKQTRSLHLQGKNGRQYVFRSVNKDASRSLPPGAEDLPVGSLIQDMTAIFHPSGAVIIPPLLGAVSVLHVSPRLYVMPQDPRLGDHLATFGGMLGILEERPEEGARNAPGFASAKQIVGHEKLLEALRKDSRNRVDERDRLTARLIDFLVGDTDRGPDQWRWARFGEGDSYRWRPIPRDRDFAFVQSDGLVPRIAGMVFKRLTVFGDELPPLDVLTFSARYEDRLFLQSLDGPAWAAIAEDTRQRLSDFVIENAVRNMLPEHYALVGEEIALKLRMRREALPAIAREYYEQLAAFVDVHASERSELAEIRRLADGGVEVRLYHGGPEQVASVGASALPPGRPFYERRFVPAETEEIRIYLHGGDDRVLIDGPNTDDAIAVRIIAGDGIDELVDLSVNGDGGTHSWFYDDSGAAGRVTRGRHTDLDRKSFTEPERPRNSGLTGETWHFRDWGTTTGYAPVLNFRDNTGFIVGLQYGTREYGFRRMPFKSQGRAKLLYAPGAAAFGAELGGETHFENSQFSVAGEVRASGYDDLRFYGYGNDSRDIDTDSSLVELESLHASAGVRYGLGDTRVALGGSMEIRDTPVEQGLPLATIRPLGVGEWAQYGIWTTAQTHFIDRRVSLAVDAAYHPAAASLTDAYAKGYGEAVVRIGSVPELALRAIGEKIWGNAPFHDAAFIGGRKGLRGYAPYRFAGDAAVVGNAELRIPVLNHFTLFLLGDAGRVYFDGESPGDWHAAYGGGITFSVAHQAINAIYAHGEGDRLYVTLGRTF